MTENASNISALDLAADSFDENIIAANRIGNSRNKRLSLDLTHAEGDTDNANVVFNLGRISSRHAMTQKKLIDINFSGNHKYTIKVSS